MLKVLTAAEMREVDRLTVEEQGIPSLELMESAAASVVRTITDRFGSPSGRRFKILCGRGNNGGDGAAIARQLVAQGAHVTAVLFAAIEETSGDARINFERLIELAAADDSGGLVIANADSVTENNDKIDFLIDAVLGTGLSRPLDQKTDELLTLFVTKARSEGAKVIAVDLPSGLFSDRADQAELCTATDLTVTFTAPKLSNVMPPASRLNGELVITDIGSLPDLITRQSSQTFLTTEDDARVWLGETAFAPDSYKQKRGHAVIFAGSREFPGAAVLASNAAMVSGAGLVSLCAPIDAMPLIASRIFPEIILREVSAAADFNAEAVRADAVLLGCGVGLGSAARDIVLQTVSTATVPVIIDADALSIIAPLSDLRRENVLAPLVLTPHPGEFRRLTGQDAVTNRIDAVRELAMTHQVFVVLKGERTLIAAPDGRVCINPTGNPGLGKAGNGDTLAGIIAGFVAQSQVAGFDLFRTVVAAVYLAGKAGDRAATRVGMRALRASDVRDALGEVFREFEG